MLTVPTAATHIALMVTRRCNMACQHCSVESSPQIRGEPDEADVLNSVRQAAAAGVRSMLLTGGEPMLRPALVVRLLQECKKLGIATSITTNGFWGKSVGKARRQLKVLRRAGLGILTVSYDRYHDAFHNRNPAVNIVRAAEDLSFPVNVSVVREEQDADLAQLVSAFEESRYARLRFYDVQPVGHARDFAQDVFRADVEGFCGACASPALTDDGRVTACNGPSYFAPPGSPLSVGSLRDTPLLSLLQRHWQDPVLDTIRTFGPARLRDELQQMPDFAAFPFRKRYSGVCDLCQHITADVKAVTALRQKLNHPRLVAERRAVWQVMAESRKDGALNRDYVNRIGAGRVFLRAVLEPENPWDKTAENILGRADFDWNQQAVYLAACGLARPLLDRLADPALTRWAPQFFIERVKTQAMRDGFKELIQREILSRLAQVLADSQGRGVLLKGAARLALATHRPDATPERATGDIDVYVEPALASSVRGQLIALGFQGDPDAPRTAPHHLAPVSFQGIPVEIHTRLMPAFWGLPETDMLEHAQPVPGAPALATLDAEGFLLHAGVHISSHLFAFGLKTAWDLAWITTQFPELDCDRCARWIAASRIPRGFWVPVRVLCQELGIGLPLEFLQRAPLDARQHKLETIARRRLFHACEGSFELNPFSKNAVFMFLHDGWLKRARYLTALAGGEAAEARHTAQHTIPGQAMRHLPHQLRQALVHWRQYREVV